MIRRLAVCSTAAAVAFATSASAAPARVSDAKGDWHIPSQDILSASMSTDRSGRVVLSMKLAAPLAETPGTYHVVFYKDECDSFVATLDWRGPSLPRTSGMKLGTWCSRYLAAGVHDPRPAPTRTVPAPTAVAGDTITWTLPALPELARGTVLSGPVPIAAPNPEVIVGFWLVGTDTPPVEVTAFDIAYGGGTYVVGSR